MEMTAEQFQAEARRRRGARRRGAAPYSSAERDFAVAYARAGQRQGRSVTASASALGISDPTLREWMAKAKATTPGSALRTVVVKTTTPSGSAGLTLVTPSGYRLRGLDVASAAALLRVVG
jgi:hypothetical protein